MHLNPYGEYAVLLAASLANDWPETRAGIEERTLELGMTQTFPPAADDHEKVRAVIDDWLAIVDEPDPDARAVLLNAQLAAAAAYPRLTNHDGEGWHLHYRDDVPSLPYVLRAIISLGTSLHLVTRGMSRLGRCQAMPCTNVVADVTRNGRQRFCSVRCANRAAVRRHRARA
ncbi:MULTISPECIES: CGNR zinc finger domain-containing protein [unclassified Microbacterium]|uniref:CGNR zinc finger domain-containing protein n=1 Tax=unclassified Microbacterium TaxID=2609290 RepID=UPI000492EE7F|nr:MULTISPECIES: CGNR zinc finger domain-containing protein [unclassified Microbacterium]MCV0334539.1 CGNR zinc finger domain-containing protein [Microbacterium sp.]MCV0376275.1 CGNR zinc finger domain-containing protein [Microbacterium sp.]MCV0389834.1 CGNR zinc finger domain-containing protein [Microbacterium sp.]MCV0419369.1 CGNR zinc finger domain-containing protein [Microbacterium sp.]MCV0421674.1 CGNR zinc finger domain-containing protein [Microbacterium sp.]